MPRLREIKRLGGSTFIKLNPSDLSDYELEEGDMVDVEDILKKAVRKYKIK